MALRLRVLVEDGAALKAISNVSTKAGGLSRGLAGMGSAGRVGFGGIAAAMTASGLPNQFGELQTLLGNAAMGFDQLGGKKIRLGSIVTGAGVLTAALGGIGISLGDPLEKARAQLDQSIRNAHGSVAALSAPIGAEQKKMQSLGFIYTDTDLSLARLTQGFGSTKKALKEESLAADLAARNHISLEDAATLVVKAYAKSPMVLKQFGINTTDITKKGTAAVAAQKAHAKAIEELGKKQLAQQQLEARLGAKSTTTGGASQASIISAQNAVAAAGTKVQEIHARIAAGTLTGVSAADQLAAAQGRVTASMARLDAAQSKTGKTTGLTVAEQQQLTNAQSATQQAQLASFYTGVQANKTAGDLNKTNLTGQQILDMLTKKTHGLAAAQANTFGGKLRAWKADVEDFGATYGAKFGKVLIMSGPLLAATGTLIESGFFGKIGKGVSKLGGYALKMLGFGNSAETAGAESEIAGKGIGGMGTAAETATGQVSGVGLASQTASPFTQTLGSTAATSGTEVEGLGGASLAATPEIAGMGAAAKTATGEEAGLGGAGLGGAGGAAAGEEGGAAAIAGGIVKGLTTAALAAVVVDVAGRFIDRFLPGNAKNPATWKGAGTEVFGHPLQALKDLLPRGGGLRDINAAGQAALHSSTQLGVTAHLPKLDNELAAKAAKAAGSHNVGAMVSSLAAMKAEFAKLPHSLSAADKADPTAHVKDVMGAISALFLKNQISLLEKQVGKANPKTVARDENKLQTSAANAYQAKLGKAAEAVSANTAAITDLKGYQANLMKFGTVAQSQASVGKLTTQFNTEAPGSPEAKQTLAQIRTLSEHIRDLRGVSARIATDQHTAAGLKSVEKAVIAHPVVAHYDQSTHVSIANMTVPSSDPQQFLHALDAAAHRANFSGEGTPTSTGGG